MIRRSIAAAVVLIFVTGCAGATAPAVPTSAPTPTPAQGLFVPTATLDTSQVEVVPPTIYVKVTPPECIDALDAAAAYMLAQDAILKAEDAVMAAFDPGVSVKTFNKALAKLTKAIAARDALDVDAMITSFDDCRDAS